MVARGLAARLGGPDWISPAHHLGIPARDGHRLSAYTAPTVALAIALAAARTQCIVTAQANQGDPDPRFLLVGCLLSFVRTVSPSTATLLPLLSQS